MSGQHTPAPVAMRRARLDCEAVAVGPFTPIVLERYTFIGGERGVRLGMPTQTEDGRGAIIWTHKATGEAS